MRFAVLLSSVHTPLHDGINANCVAHLKRSMAAVCVSASAGPVTFLLLTEILLAALGIRLHGGSAWSPVGRADLAVLVHELGGTCERTTCHISSHARAWNALTRRSTSSTLRPTGRSLTVIWRSTPSGLMMNKPLRTGESVRRRASAAIACARARTAARCRRRRRAR